MGYLRCPDLQTRPLEVLAWTSLTLEKFRRLVPPFEAAFQTHMAQWCCAGQPRTCFIIGRTQSTLVLWRRRWEFSAGRHQAVRKGNAHTRRLQGTGTKSIIETPLRPKHRMRCFLLERTASR